MSITFYLRKPILVEDIISKTDIKVETDGPDSTRLILGDSCLHAGHNDCGIEIVTLVRYFANCTNGDGRLIWQELVKKLGVQFISEYTNRACMEDPAYEVWSNEDGSKRSYHIPDEIWEEYTQSVFFDE